MAGGFGKRLRHITNVISKPLIPLNEKTIVEEIMDRFVKHGCHNFYLMTNYKAEIIYYYFNQVLKHSYQIEFIKENKPLGTAGSLSLLEGKINQTFFVSNCDIVIDQDYHEILKYHKENKNEITIVAAIHHFSIPYGTLETTENGLLKSLNEKPNLNFKINSGMYILEPHLLKEIERDNFFHITYLIENVLKRKGKVGVFPVSAKSWKDIGNWNDFVNQHVTNT
jgi:NDP-sugar pyrophosphorylase family protein